LERVGDAPLPPACLDEPDGARDSVRRIIGQAEGERQVEQDLGVSLALDLGNSDSSTASTRSRLIAAKPSMNPLCMNSHRP
jgi:hypothetical protein